MIREPVSGWQERGDSRFLSTKYFRLEAYYTYTGWYGCSVVYMDDKITGTPELFDTMSEAQIAAEDLLRLELEAELARLG